METLAKMVIGAVFAILSLMFMVETSPTSYKNIVDNAIKECEKSLPRNQNCKIIAVPKE